MSSLQSLRELINERLAAAAEEICRLCEGTIVQYEQELCRQRRLLDICWKPQIQLKDLSQHSVTEEEDLCNPQRNIRVKQEVPEPLHIEEELRKPKLPQIKEEQEPTQIEEEKRELPQVKEEQEGFYISQDEEQLDLKEETCVLMKTPTYEENENSEADGNNQQNFNVIHTLNSNQHEESTTDEETDPQNRDQRKKRDRSHVQSVASSHESENTLSSVKSKIIAGNTSLHIRRVSDEGPYVCEKCGKSFSLWSHFRIHMTTHTEDKRFSCKVCDKSFSTRFILKAHMRTHTGEKPFTCKECSKSFSQISSLKTHIRVHTGEKPFPCKMCDSKFSQISSFNRHIRTHTGEKPFTCKECDKKFYDISNLKAHMRTHTGEKPFSCTVCDRSFSRMSDLKRHIIRTHT